MKKRIEKMRTLLNTRPVKKVKVRYFAVTYHTKSFKGTWYFRVNIKFFNTFELTEGIARETAIPVCDIVIENIYEFQNRADYLNSIKQ